jgi:hypothetical protein
MKSEIKLEPRCANKSLYAAQASGTILEFSEYQSSLLQSSITTTHHSSPTPNSHIAFPFISSNLSQNGMQVQLGNATQ